MPDENTLRAGRICGNPMRGLCDRVVIEANRVYDGCMIRRQNEPVALRLHNMTAGLIPPFQFISCASYGDAKPQDQKISQLEGHRIRIEETVVIPVKVRYTDAEGREGSADSEVRERIEVILKTPLASLTPYRIQEFAVAASEIGSFISTDTVHAQYCMTIVIKEIVPTDIVLPCYGNCVYPDCRQGESVCEALERLPLFPPLE